MILPTPLDHAYSMENSDTSHRSGQSAQQKLSIGDAWPMKALYESTLYTPKIENLDLSCDINHGSAIFIPFGYELHLHLELSIKALAYTLNFWNSKRRSSQAQ